MARVASHVIAAKSDRNNRTVKVNTVGCIVRHPNLESHVTYVAQATTIASINIYVRPPCPISNQPSLTSPATSLKLLQMAGEKIFLAPNLATSST
ncbi:hypothetical protein HNQ77_000593 [Silvibacterium bohemicum]|uniref:Uncharacterized protein n=1 Tax=Silvibacterium bohemicum TaxID=1577686 RepID=A0A841JQF5_9BACT|nr:hypothetical protein [Silvibacterium bohemicum]